MTNQGIIMRLAGPLQAWGERSSFTVRDTATFPTRSGVLGMAAAAEGIGRDQYPSGYEDLELAIRIDRPGARTVDFHTTGGGYPPEGTAATAGGEHKNAAVLSYRHYLTDAAFTVAITGPAPVITRITSALDHPHWAPYLGRRSCPPDEPLLLARSSPDAITELRTAVPLAARTTTKARTTAKRDAPTVAVDFIWEHQPANPAAAAFTITDQPSGAARQFHTRRLWRTTEHLPGTLVCEPYQARQRLLDYAIGSTR
ncbi:CRISPR-associated protein, Cas5e family [Glycomyces sambucus]|uniref:CRISPR-associated protein, Cas5e family n=1 Tax=Glycomyces sambucus TaxID=380244 RepID=A0A1G9CLW7_9ACTN|nr:type I-E CRISPR-associated protein Cas5/CasD [Glycomyces sambucus]SDK52657.1 CRISPR-associated protein, Cas5e family [Glycomyces sambucus]